MRSTRAQDGSFIGGASLVAVLATALVGCLFTDATTTGTGSSSSSGATGDPAQCADDDDCAHFDTDQDNCTKAVCNYGKCAQQLVKGTAECQCHTDDDCTYYEKDCSRGTCKAHRCTEQVAPAGPAPKQEQVGDCKRQKCDGTSALAATEYAPDDADDGNPCTADSCDPAQGAKHTNVANGTSCGDGAICFEGRCLACKPQNATSCGGEGADEPKNNTSTTPSPMKEYTPFCAFSSASDVDWYTFYAKDDDFTYDLMKFRFWSTAPSIEVCAYVSCVGGGEPGGGCTSKLAGPNGSRGCCWTGAPDTLAPTWDLDCPTTSEDSGTVYVSVRTPGGDACEVYAMTGGY